MLGLLACVRSRGIRAVVPRPPPALCSALSMVYPTIPADVPVAPKSPPAILNDDDEDIQVEQQAPPATILSSPPPAAQEAPREREATPTPPHKPGGVDAVVDIATMPPILPIPPESSAAADDCGIVNNSMAALPATATPPPPPPPAAEGAEEKDPARSQRDSSSGTADSGRASTTTAKYGAAQSSMPRNFRLSLDGYVLQNDQDGKYAAYRISVTAGLHTWLVLRRYAPARRACCVSLVRILAICAWSDEG